MPIQGLSWFIHHSAVARDTLDGRGSNHPLRGSNPRGPLNCRAPIDQGNGRSEAVRCTKLIKVARNMEKGSNQINHANSTLKTG